MNAKLEIEIADQNVIVSAFRKENGTTELFEAIAAAARAHVPDVTTKKGREAIGSLALKISKSKTLIDKCGKELVADQKAQIKLIDDDRIAVVKRFDELRNEILAPRNAWEQAEKDRVNGHNAFIMSFVVMSAPQAYENRDSSFIEGMVSEIENTVVDDSLEEFKEQAELAKFKALDVLRTALADRQKYEAEQAELERLRQAEQARLQREHEERIAREAAEKATREAEEKARFEAERVQREKIESEQREARLKAEKEAAELRAAQAAENERKRIEAEQFAKAEAERKATEEREADQAHKKLICSEALKGLTDLGVSVEQGKVILNAINKGLVPHVSIKF